MLWPLLPSQCLGGGGIAEAVSDSARTKVNFDVDPVISITAPESGNLEDPNNPGQPISPTQDGTIATFSEAVTVSTNNLTGYKLLMSMGTGSSNNALVSTTTPSNTIPSIAIDTTTTLANLPPNTWAYTLEEGASATYRSLPDPLASSPTDKQHTIKADGAMGTETTNVSFATKIAISQPSGQYQNSVLFTATTNEPPAITPKAILGENGNLNFVYDSNHYDKGQQYEDNTGTVTIAEVYDNEHASEHGGKGFPDHHSTSDRVPWKANTAIRSANFDDSFYYYQPTSTVGWFHSLYNLPTINNIKNLNTSNTTDMGAMFSWMGRDAANFELDLSTFDTHKVTRMAYMFDAAGRNTTGSFILRGLDDWDTSQVTDMLNMFTATGHAASTWSIGDLSKWNVGAVNNMIGMFQLAGFNAETWSVGNLYNWDTRNVRDMAYMFDMWQEDRGPSATQWSIGDISQWQVGKVQNMFCMFRNVGVHARNWNIGNLNQWDVSQVTTMEGMFHMTGRDTEHWDIGDLHNWQVGNVKHMGGMFFGAGASSDVFQLDLSKWDIHNVTSINRMFNDAGYGAKNGWSVGDLSKWNTSSVKDMGYLFYNAGHDSPTWSVGDISQWDTSKVTYMKLMFNSIGYSVNNEFDLDLSGWDTRNVTDMSYMFGGLHKVHRIYVGDYWSIENVDIPAGGGDYVFVIGDDDLEKGSVLEGGAGTKWQYWNTHIDYARIDNPPDYPGYLTYKGFNPPTPVNPGGGGENIVNNVTNVFNNIFNNNNNDNNTNTTDSKDGYVAPQGVLNTSSSNSPNWFLIICLSILSLGLIALIIFMIYKLRKQKQHA